MSYIELREQIINNRYIPIPIVPAEKKPAVKGWTSPDYIPPVTLPPHLSECGVGIKCGCGDYPVAAVDIDVVDSAIVKDMLSYISRLVGDTMYRIGKEPKILMVYRYESEGAYKRKSSAFDCGSIEVLGFGQQFVAYGIHPDTKQPYTWYNGSPVETERLPVLKQEQTALIFAEFERLAWEHGSAQKSKKQNPASSHTDYDPNDPLDRKEPVGKSAEEIKELLKNFDPNCEYGEWVKVLMACHHESGGSPDVLRIVDEWSSKGKTYKHGEVELKWNSFGVYTGEPVTIRTLLDDVKEETKEEAPDDYFGDETEDSVAYYPEDYIHRLNVVDGMLRKGDTALLFSDGGVGKSSISLHMGVKVSIAPECEVSFLGHSIPTGGRVFLLTAEDGKEDVGNRLHATVAAIAKELGRTYKEIRQIVNKNFRIRVTKGDRVRFFGQKHKGGALKATKYYESFLCRLRKIENLQLVIIDTKARYSSAEEISNEAATEEVEFYERIAIDTGAAVLILHHTNKQFRGETQDGIQAFRGATALYDSARSVFYLRGFNAQDRQTYGIADDTPGKYSIWYNLKGNHLSLSKPILIERDFFSYAVVYLAETQKPDKSEIKRQQARSRIIEALSESGQMSIAGIAAVVSMDPRTVSNHVKVLEADGCVVCENQGNKNSVELTEHGKKAYGLTIQDDLV